MTGLEKLALKNKIEVAKLPEKTKPQDDFKVLEERLANLEAAVKVLCEKCGTPYKDK